MKSISLLAVCAFTAFALLGADVADAKRLGGGRTMGMQRSAPPPAAAPAPTRPGGAATDPVMPAQPGPAMNAARPGAAAASAAPAASGASRWLGPIAGIAAGLGLAALMSHLGLSEAFGSILLLGLLVIGAVVLARMFLARRPAVASPGAGNGSFRTASPEPRARMEPVLNGGPAESRPAPAQQPVPPGFNAAPFLQQAKVQFRRLQSAYDAGDRATLADVMTPTMYAEIVGDLDKRDTHVATDVVALDAEILEVVTEGRQYVASVRFNGAIREDGANEAKPFVEVWHLTKPIDGSSGWLLAGIQQNEESLAAQ